MTDPNTTPTTDTDADDAPAPVDGATAAPDTDADDAPAPVSADPTPAPAADAPAPASAADVPSATPAPASPSDDADTLALLRNIDANTSLIVDMLTALAHAAASMPFGGGRFQGLAAKLTRKDGPSNG